MAQKEGRNFGRINASAGTDITSANIALGVGWGDGATAVSVRSGSNDQAGQISVTSAGANQAQATATVTLTFTDGAYSATPIAAIITTTNNNSIDTGHVTYTLSTTALVMTFSVLPVDTKVYVFNYVIIAN